MIEGFASNPLYFDDGKKVSRAKMPHRYYKRDAVSVFHQISQSAQSVFNTKRRSDSEQPKRHRSDDIAGNARNTEQNSEPTQKEELIKNAKIVVDRNNFEDSRPWPKSLMEKVEEMLKIEEHYKWHYKCRVVSQICQTRNPWACKRRQSLASSQLSQMRAFVSPSSWSPWIKKTVFGVFREME